MDAMERYATTEASLGPNVLQGLPIDTAYLLGATDVADETMYYGINDLVTEPDQVVTVSLQPVDELVLEEILAEL